MPEQLKGTGPMLGPGSPVIAYLQTPKERVWGILQDINPSGAFIRGIDLNTFDDWTRMIAKGERNIGLGSLFFPMWRIERLCLDESVDEIPSLCDRFFSRVGLTVEEYLGRSNTQTSL